MDSLRGGYPGVAFSAGSLLALYLLYLLGRLTYNVFFHPLKHIPGPLGARASILLSVINMRMGNAVSWIKVQHEKYGDVVRVAPNEVSFISGESAWPDIYGFRTGKYKNTGSYLKDRKWFAKSPNGVNSVVTADEAGHTRMRRNLSHAFSDKALRMQESLIQGYVDLLVFRIGERAKQGQSMDIMRWYNYTTFDIISDLAFGTPLHCLRDSHNHEWIKLVVDFIQSGVGMSTRAKAPPLVLYDRMVAFFSNASSSLMAGRLRFFERTQEQVKTRLEAGVLENRNDFFNFIMKNQEKDAQRLTRGEMDVNATTFLVAGTETTATTLAGATFLLLQHPHAYRKLVHEIRSAFRSDAEITIEAVNGLEYLIACFQEALRIYPPVPTGLPRLVPAAGDTISGHYIAGGTSVYVSQHAANHCERNFKDADLFVPERWLGDERYKNDKTASWNPFSFGPRNCLGKNLAYAEMRLILAKVLFNFDLALVGNQDDWMAKQKVYILWEKPALMVNVTAVEQK